MDLFLINFKEEKIKKDNKKLQSSISKYYAEKILKDFFNITSVLAHKKNGSPYFENSDINISISHSHSLIALLFSKEYCGVDVEFMKKRDFDKILEHFKINLKNTDKELFYQIWTDYEARYKAKNNKSASYSFIYENYMCSICSVLNEKINIYKVKNENYKKINNNLNILKPLQVKINSNF